MSPVAVCLAVPGMASLAVRLGATLVVAAVLVYGFVLSALAGPAAIGGKPERDDYPSAQAVARVAGGVTLDQEASSRAADAARGLVGRPYVWGGVDPASGVDCSGLVQWSFRQASVSVPRTAQQQFDATSRLGTHDLRPGDLVFFSICCQPPDVVTHVGVYLGSGRMVHAPAPGETVRVESISTPYWRAHWAGAGRVVSTPGAQSPRS